MNSSKVFEIINVLNQEEWKKLKLWLNSPWANSNKKIMLLYSVIESGFPDFSMPKWKKEQVYKKVYAGKPYNNREFNNLLSKFHKQVKLFLVHMSLSKHPRLIEQIYVKEMLERGAIDIFENSAGALLQQIENVHPKTATDYYDLNQLYQQLYYQPSTRLRIQPGFSVINQAQNNLEAYYQLQHFKYLHDIEIRKKMLKDNSKEEKIIKAELPEAVRLYQNRFSRKEGINIASYLSFKSLYYEYFNGLTFEHQQYFLFCCINDSINLNANKNIDALQELFEHYQFGFKHDLLLRFGKMTAITFNNIVLVASHLEKIDFVAAFIPKYYLFLEDSHQNDAYRWGLAELSYMNGEYEKCVDLIQKDKFDSDFFKLQSKGTLLRANFDFYLEDKSQYDRLQSLYNATEKHFHRNNMLSKPRKKSYIRFTQYLRRLTVLVEENIVGTKELVQFRKSISNEEKLFGKGWLLKKCSQLFE